MGMFKTACRVERLRQLQCDGSEMDGATTDMTATTRRRKITLAYLTFRFGCRYTPLFSGFTSSMGRRNRARVECSGTAYSTARSRRPMKRWRSCGYFMLSIRLPHCARTGKHHERTLGERAGSVPGTALRGARSSM